MVPIVDDIDALARMLERARLTANERKCAVLVFRREEASKEPMAHQDAGRLPYWIAEPDADGWQRANCWKRIEPTEEAQP